MSEITCLGVLVADVVGKPIEKMPDRGKLALVERIELHSGGCAANTGAALAKLGVSTSILGKVGNDGFGDFLVNYLSSQGVEMGGVIRDNSAATSSTMVMVHGDGERSFIHYLGANATLALKDVDFQRIASSRLFHVAGSFLMPSLDGEPTANLLKRAREAGVITTLDTAWDATGGWMKTLEPCLPHLDYLLPSWEEARSLAGGRESPQEVAQFLLDKGPNVVGLKMGEHGSYVRSRDGYEVSIPAFKVEMVDALGAGDAWVAGFLTGVIKGWGLEKCARLGNGVGAACVTALGAGTGLLNFPDTLEFIKMHTGSSL